MIRTQNLGQNNSRFEVFFSKEDKINMYQKGSKIQEYYPISRRHYIYLMKILNRYDTTWLDRPHHKRKKEEKLDDIH
ncbi:hypothetical protein ACWCL1_04620 [Ligilactobacillus sp. LYQ135]